MAPYGLLATDGSYTPRSAAARRASSAEFHRPKLSAQRLQTNPKPAAIWDYTRSIIAIRRIFPMFELTIDGLEQAVTHLMQKYDFVKGQSWRCAFRLWRTVAAVRQRRGYASRREILM
jgi:hypothetical protein